VYPRCQAGVSFACDVFILSLRSGRGHKLRSVSTRRWSENAIAVWGRRFLFQRSCIGSYRCRGLGLFVAPPLRRIARGYFYPSVIDLRGRVVAFIRSGQVPYDSSAHDRILVAHLLWSGEVRRCVVADARRKSYRPSDASVFGFPVVTKQFVYWVAGPDTSTEHGGPTYFLRRGIPTSDCQQRGRVQVLRPFPTPTGDSQIPEEIAVTSGRVFYTTLGPPAPGDFRPLLSLFEMTDPPVRDP
jgi:hypothetical protein